MLELIVFDFDGTIAETVLIKEKAMHRVGGLFGAEAADALLAYHRLHTGVSRYEKYEWLFESVLKKPLSAEESKRLGQIFSDYCLEEIQVCELVPGVQDCLDRWKGRVPMYVASGAPHEELGFILKERGLAGYFEGIYGYPPNKTALLARALRESSALPQHAVMVGDSSTDSEAADAMGTLFYGRGAFFSGTTYPWHEDLTRLNDWLEALAEQS